MTGRIQLAINVDDLEESIGFYSKLFGAEPAKVRPGYANFAIADPPLKLILTENPGQGGSLNHLGVEVAVLAPEGSWEAAEAALDASEPAPGAGVCCGGGSEPSGETANSHDTARR